MEDVEELRTIDWDYHMPFDGFRMYLSEQGIEEYSLVIDREGNNQNTLNAAFELGHAESVESDSEESFGIRIADFCAGIISKFMKSLSRSLSYEYIDVQKKILDNKWFDLNKNQHQVFSKLRYVLSGINNCWYKSYSGVFADDLIVFIALLEYIDNNTVDDLKNTLDRQGEYFNSYSTKFLREYFDNLHNKVHIEPITIKQEEYYINKWGAKVYIDSKIQPNLVIENGKRECYVMNAGFDSNGIPTITIEDEGKYVCYRIPESLSCWVQALIGLVNMGMQVLPSKVMFTIKEGNWFADIL